MTFKRIYFAATLLLIAATVACGSGSSLVLSNPKGNFSDASLKGSYVYEIHGFDSSFNPYREVGVFTADGNKNITGGTNDFSFDTAATQSTGNYNIVSDGTGFLAISTSQGTLTFAVTMVSASKIQLIESDGFVNARGVAELQDPNALATTPSGTFVFRLHQEISTQDGSPASEVGAISISGASVTGNMDENDAGTFNSAVWLTGTFTAPAALGRGTASIVNSNTSFTTDFVYYVVNSGKFVMLVNDPNASGSGSAELQSGAVSAGLSGNFAFGSRGDDADFFGGIATVGQFNASSGTISGTEDSSQDGSITSSAPFSSCYTASANGRVVVNTVSGNTCTSTVQQVFWIVSPSRAFFVNAGTSSVEDGTADLQQPQALTASTFNQQYSLAMDGVDTGAVSGATQLLSRVGTLQFNGTGKLTLNEVVNGSALGAGAQNPGALTGTYSVGSNGRVTGTLNGNNFNLVMYAVSASQAYVLQTDRSLITSGSLQLQQ